MRVARAGVCRRVARGRRVDRDRGPNARDDDDDGGDGGDDDRGAGGDAIDYYRYMTTATGARLFIVRGARARARETEIESFTRA